jgi:predicted enzyme related to lactoylglutathione lyase
MKGGGRVEYVGHVRERTNIRHSSPFAAFKTLTPPFRGMLRCAGPAQTGWSAGCALDAHTHAMSRGTRTMSAAFVPGVGAVFSADVAVPEHDREVRFYSRVLSTGEHPLWREQDLMNNLGLPIIGLGARTAEYAHLPLQWMPHIQVADVAASVRRALDLGGSELMHARADDGTSQWAVLLDPNAAGFGIVPIVPAEAIPSDGATASDPAAPMGHICWLDLTVPDASATRDFYRQVIGCTVQGVEMKDGSARYDDYNLLREDGRPAAGVCHARGVNAGLPGVWMIYLPVADLAESLRRVQAEGGKVIKAMQGDDGQYAYAAVQDPVGLFFALTPA